MKTKIRTRLVTLVVILSVCLVSSHAQEPFDYIITVGDEILTFTSCPELGYVVKTQNKVGSMETLSQFLKNASNVKVGQVRGIGRKPIAIVYNQQSAYENEKTIDMLTSFNQIKYASPLFSSNGEMVAIIPEIVIRVKPGIEIEKVQSVCETSSCKIIKQMEFTEQEYLIEVLGLNADAVFAAVEELSQNSEVEWACPNIAAQLRLAEQVVPDDEYFPILWHLHNTGQSGGTPDADINAPEAWDITTGDPNIVVAVLDTGVDTTHPDLVDNLVPGYDFWEDDDQPDPATDHWKNGHGTACAGLVAAHGNNGLGIVGVAWNCKIMPIRIARSEDWASDADQATALRWAAKAGADILSNSWGRYQSERLATKSAIVDITRQGGIGRDGKGCVVLFATNNQGEALPYPAKYPEVIAVGATDHNDIRPAYSNYGPGLDIVAPGGDESLEGMIWTTDITGFPGFSSHPQNPYPDIWDYALFNGTSVACPIATGVAALILSIEPDLTNIEVKHFLEQSAKDLGEPGWDQYYGWGRVDARAALDMVLAKRCDLNNDWKVDIEDMLILIEFWGTDEPSVDIAPATKRDGIVDEQDIELMIKYWRTEISEMNTNEQ